MSCVVRREQRRGEPPSALVSRRRGSRRRSGAKRPGVGAHLVEGEQPDVAVEAPCPRPPSPSRRRVVCWKRVTNSSGPGPRAAARCAPRSGPAPPTPADWPARPGRSRARRTSGTPAAPRAPPPVPARRAAAPSRSTSGRNVVRACSSLASAATGRPRPPLARQLGQDSLAGRVDEERLRVRREVVAGRPLDRPVAQPSPGSRIFSTQTCSTPRRAKQLEVAARVGEAVGVVDAEPLHEPFPDQLEQLRVCRVEHPGVLDADARELVDVEEAAMAAARTVEVEERPAQRLVRARTGSPRSRPCDSGRCRRSRRALPGRARATRPPRRAPPRRGSGRRRRTRVSSRAGPGARARGTGG